MSLTKRQQEILKRHKKHHTAKHMVFMRKEMEKGKSFTESHKLAMKKVGKQMKKLHKTKSKKKFPDLNKDGKVTQADSLMGRGILKKGKNNKYG